MSVMRDRKVMKNVYSIGAVSRVTGVNIHTLRYWTDIAFVEVLQPVRTVGGQRRFSEQDVAQVLKVKQLMSEGNLTPSGIVKQLQQEAAAA